MKSKSLKTWFAAMMMVAVAAPLSAQSPNTTEKVEYSTNKYKVETNTFWNNWFISLGAGGQVYFGDHDKQMSLGKRIAPALDVAVGKWFTPGVGLRLMYSGLKIKGATQNGSHSTGEVYDSSKWLDKQKFSMYNVHADVLFNLSNLLCGYKETRIWNCSPYVGLGWARVWDAPQAKEVTANIGVLNTFRLCKALDLNVDVRGAFMNDRFDGEEGGRSSEGLLTATVGLTYKFKQRGWNRSKTVTRYDNAALDAMREKLNQMGAENERLRKALAEGNKEKAQEVVKKMASANLVTFQIGKSKLSNEARANLGMMAEAIKTASPDAVYVITGYADSGTGSKAINERLSKERAEAVYDCLTKEFGVNKSQLRIDYKGGVDNMFYDDPRLSRAVITRSE